MGVNSDLKKFYYDDFIIELKSLVQTNPKISNFLTQITNDILVNRINLTLEAKTRLTIELSEEEVTEFNSTIEKLGDIFGGFLKIGNKTLQMWGETWKL